MFIVMSLYVCVFIHEVVYLFLLDSQVDDRPYHLPSYLIYYSIYPSIQSNPI